MAKAYWHPQIAKGHNFNKLQSLIFTNSCEKPFAFFPARDYSHAFRSSEKKLFFQWKLWKLWEEIEGNIILLNLIFLLFYFTFILKTTHLFKMILFIIHWILSQLNTFILLPYWVHLSVLHKTSYKIKLELTTQLRT